MEQDVFILFGLEERDGVDFDFSEGAAVESVEDAMQKSAEEFFIEAREELRDLLLGDGGGEVDIPDGKAGECLRVAGEQAVEEGGAAAQVAEDEERFFDGLCFVTGEEDVIEPEKEPVDERAGSPDQIEQRQKDDSFSCESCGGIFRVEERAVEGAPEQAEVIVH